jgi:hypothetical protein
MDIAGQRKEGWGMEVVGMREAVVSRTDSRKVGWEGVRGLR